MQALLCENAPEAPALPSASMLADGYPTNSPPTTTEGTHHESPSTTAQQETKPATTDLCANDHANLKYGWARLDIPPTTCPQCGQTPTFLEIAITADPEADDHYALPGQVTRQWLTQHSESDVFGDVHIPDERRGGLFTAVRYMPDCEHEYPCDCRENYVIMWTLEEYIARALDTPGAIA